VPAKKIAINLQYHAQHSQNAKREFFVLHTVHIHITNTSANWLKYTLWQILISYHSKKIFRIKGIQYGIRNQLDVTWCYIYFLFISSTTCFGQPCAHPQEMTTQWFYRRVWWCRGCCRLSEHTPEWIHNQLTGSDSLHSHGTTPHAAIKPLSRQLLRMGTRLPETCSATYKEKINITPSDI